MKLTPLGRNDVPKPVGRWPGPHSSHWDDDSGAFGQLAPAWSSGWSFDDQGAARKCPRRG
jgi:hypothetical protein